GSGRRHPGRRIPLRQDADEPVPGHAIRDQGGQLPADPRRFRARHPALDHRAAPRQAVWPVHPTRAPGR
ncbi:hypothetical protein H2201_009401, partial [Coniosporium apollinis]